MIKIKNLIKLIFGLFKNKDAEIYYVNGSEMLPAPLDPATEAQMIDRLSHAEGEELYRVRNILVEHNLRLVVYIAKKFENTAIGIEDLVSIGTIGLMKAVNTFKADKNIKIATYASKCIENEILMYIRKNSSQRLEVSVDEPLNVDWDGNELLLGDVLGTDTDEVFGSIEAEEERAAVIRAIEKLPSRDKQIIHMRFGIGGGEEKTQKEVADIMGISQSYISRLEKRIIARLKKEISK